MKYVLAVIMYALLLVSAVLAPAQVPHTMSYQGLLTTSSGSPVTDGLYTLQFKLDTNSTGGIPVWTETQANVQVSHGTFSVILGSATPGGIFIPPKDSLFVEVTATAGPVSYSYPQTFAPRTQVTSAPYSMAPWMTNGNKVFYNSGNVGIGINNPQTSLHVVGNRIRLDNNAGKYIDLRTDGAYADLESNGSALGINYGTGQNTLMNVSGGSVGIGTDHPYTSVHVRKDASGGAGAYLTLMNGIGGSGANVGIDLSTYDPPPNGGSDPAARIEAIDDGNASSHVTFSTKVPGVPANTLQERMRISSAGNVGIGTPTPTHALEVAGDISLSGNLIRNYSGTSANASPVAYGRVSMLGNVFKGTANLSSQWDNTNHRYVISIAGENIDDTYFGFVTTIGDNALGVASIKYDGYGHMWVYIQRWDTGQWIYSQFNIIMKPLKNFGMMVVSKMNTNAKGMDTH